MNWFFKRVPTREIQLQVEELHCEMCAQTVREALQKVAGVNKVKVNLSKKKVLVAIAAGLNSLRPLVQHQLEEQSHWFF